MAVLLDGAADPDPDPTLLPDIVPAARRLLAAIRAGEKIAVYGDFDLDGVSGAALLFEALVLAGADPLVYIPHRSEGHGLNTGAIGTLAAAGASVIVTVDCGTNDRDEAAFAAQRGIDIIVTDHHVCHGRPIPALAIVNPSRPESLYPFRGLAGVGVAYQLARVLLEEAGVGAAAADDLLDLVAIGTIADIAPLTGPNRAYVRRGIHLLATRSRPGLAALLDVAGARPPDIGPETVGYQLAPRFNAAGRMDHALRGFELLTTRDPDRARDLATVLDRLNRERKARLAEATERLTGILDGDAGVRPVIFVEDTDLPEPLLGLLASRLVSEYGRPAIVLRWDAVECRASARAPEGYDLAAALGTCSSLFTRFGGHAQAAGFGIRTERLPELRERLLGQFEQPAEFVPPRLTIDLEVELRHHNWRIYHGLQRLAPFGAANPEPVFLSRRVKVIQSRRFGPDDRHLRLRLFDDRTAWEAVAFQRGADLALAGRQVHLVYHLRENVWNGERTLRLHVLDFAPAG